MALPATDDFNRADENPLGGNWTKAPGADALQIVSNVVTDNNSTQDQTHYWNADTFDADQYSEYDFVDIDDGGPCVRITTTGTQKNYYTIAVIPTQITVYKWANNSATALGASFTRTNTDGERFRLEVEGTTLRVYVYVSGSPSLLFTRTDSSHAGGQAGARLWQDGPHSFDNWEGGNLSTVTVNEVTLSSSIQLTDTDLAQRHYERAVMDEASLSDVLARAREFLRTGASDTSVTDILYPSSERTRVVDSQIPLTNDSVGIARELVRLLSSGVDVSDLISVTASGSGVVRILSSAIDVNDINAVQRVLDRTIPTILEVLDSVGLQRYVVRALNSSVTEVTDTVSTLVATVISRILSSLMDVEDTALTARERSMAALSTVVVVSQVARQVLLHRGIIDSVSVTDEVVISIRRAVTEVLLRSGVDVSDSMVRVLSDVAIGAIIMNLSEADIVMMVRLAAIHMRTGQ